jgi:vacuolar-type H+-ATPase subunit F/Vma7
VFGFVIGDNDMVTGFRLVGVHGTEVNSPVSAKEALEKLLTRNDLALIIISEEFSTDPKVHEVIDKIRRENLGPLIVEVPPSNAKTSKLHMADLITKSLGVKM